MKGMEGGEEVRKVARFKDGGERQWSWKREVMKGRKFCGA